MPLSLVCLVLLQAALMAAVPQRLRPISREVASTACAPGVEGMSLLVDRISDSDYGLMDPVAPRQPAPGVPSEQAPIYLQVYPQDLLGPEQVRHLIEIESYNNGVDPLLIESIVRQESGFDPCAVSRAGAMGLMQLMPETATGLGVSDPFDPGQNVSGGVRYFARHLHSYGGNVPLALAAYNAGPGAVQKYGGIPPYAETLNYVDSVLDDWSYSRSTLPGQQP